MTTLLLFDNAHEEYRVLVEIAGFFLIKKYVKRVIKKENILVKQYQQNIKVYG